MATKENKEIIALLKQIDKEVKEIKTLLKPKKDEFVTIPDTIDTMNLSSGTNLNWKVYNT